MVVRTANSDEPRNLIKEILVHNFAPLINSKSFKFKHVCNLIENHSKVYFQSKAPS